jgi:hypothetical protein
MHFNRGDFEKEFKQKHKYLEKGAMLHDKAKAK